MIPAILSCVFVLYLYRTLNPPDAESDGLLQSDPTARLNEIQNRLDRLVSKSQQEAKQ